jgi:16S rRNA (guanine966-N2)-methyltransferase
MSHLRCYIVILFARKSRTRRLLSQNPIVEMIVRRHRNGSRRCWPAAAAAAGCILMLLLFLSSFVAEAFQLYPSSLRCTKPPHPTSDSGGHHRSRRTLLARPDPKPLPNVDEIPANLRRTVTAKRPQLGHVVPKRFRTATTAGGSSAPQLRAQGKERSPNSPGNLRIAGGTARGRKLDSPDVFLRPMMGKVKEAVFSTFQSFGLYDDTALRRHLDVFAGSGSVGLESLSRGATHCTFVDFSDNCCACIERNLDITQLHGKYQELARIVCADALSALREPESAGIPAGSTYQMVTLCPPYEEVVYMDLLEAAVGSPLVSDDTVLLIEYPVELKCLPHVVQSNSNTAVGVRNRRYGRTVIAMYVINPTGKLLDTANSRPEEFVAVG